MEFTHTHARQAIIAAVQAAAEQVAAIASVQLAGASLEAPEQGVTADVSFVEENVLKIAGNGMPRSGQFRRDVTVAVIVSAQVPLDMAIEDFEGAVLGDLERAILMSDELEEIAHDIVPSQTQWAYAQDAAATIVRAVAAFTITYLTDVGEPGVAV